MAEIDYIPVATGGGANVMPQATFAGLAPNGVVPGLADPTYANKMWRQSSMIGAAVAAFISAMLGGINVIDDGNLSALTSNFTLAVAAGISATEAVVSGAHTYAASDQGVLVERSNSGAAMIDVLPGTGTAVLAKGWRSVIKNVDSAGVLYIAPAAGANLDNSATGFVVLGPGQTATFWSDGSNYWTTAKPDRARIAAATNLYVNAASGSDANSGLTVGSAFKTIQGAADYLKNNFDLNGQGVTVNLAAGTYAGVEIDGPWVGGTRQAFGTNSIAPVTILGNAGAPDNCIISGATSAVSVIDSLLNISGVKLTSANGSCLYANEAAGLYVIGAVDFGTATGGDHMTSFRGSSLIVLVPYTISGGSTLNHYHAGLNGYIGITNITTITLTGTPNFAQSFAYCDTTSTAQLFGNTYSGAATGLKFIVATNGCIVVNGAGVNYFPGNVAGTSGTGGEYN